MTDAADDASPSPYRALPSVERLASDPRFAAREASVRVRAVRQALEAARLQIRVGEPAPPWEHLAAHAEEILRQSQIPHLRRAINATGILLHTNLGRATLAPEAALLAAEVGAGHASLEIDEETGGRGSRQTACADLLCELTGSEDAFVVNNNAAATFLAIAGLASGREVVLSRGQMVEIGGQFRLPDVIESAGARLREVGTTNRTRLADYERVIGPETALLLRVHPSNYCVVGFSESATLDELVALGKERGIPVGDDIGSGALVDFSAYGLTDEPTAPYSIAHGADIVWFSGDKLLGGPQAGILIGRRDHIAPLRRHPLARALRPDKMTLAALEMTLRLYVQGHAWQEVPILRRIARPADEILHACGRVARALRIAAPHLDIDIVATEAQIGGGSLPGHTLPSWAVAIASNGANPSLTELARALRKAPTPVYGRLEKDRLLLDLRAVEENEEADIARGFG